MANLDIQEKVISKRNEGFPDWLDFDKMRQEGIDYLGELSGNIWTDHNAHDPGITILEVLCYALMDLGYRTALPTKDLFAKDPDETSPENNFFTPAAILGCNPLTITDYRKLLIDIPGVKNAWLIAAEDITLQRICLGEKYDYHTNNYNRIKDCAEFLNGLYHVYIDLETTVQRKDEAVTSIGALKEEEVIENVRKALLAHRNLCEDFFDITVLCKQRLGICADVTLHPSADPEKVFFLLMEKLHTFLSPSPKFYRLKQLYEKGKTIEEIFEGRPFDLKKSHGFVDVEEFEKITLQKEIHISDLYNAVGSVEGIISVRNIRIRNSDGSICPGTTDWIFKLYENHVPVFDPLASGLNFLSSRGSIVKDTRALSQYFKANPDIGSKALMTAPTANLDMLPEPGNFRKDLAAYYPIENDFPKVYGITEGSLPDDVSPERKAQSLQLRAYLLFFDTLLAGYLGQLKNIRNLFAISQQNKELQHTYFVNKLADRPGLGQLVPFALSDTTPYPTTQAFPVCRKDFEEVLATGMIDRCSGEKEFPPHRFCSAAERDVAIQQLMEDLKHGNFSEEVFSNKSGCWSFYFFTASERYVIVGTDFYQSERDARAAAETLMYLCTSEKSFRRYTTSDKNGFSFNIVSSVAGYWDYLGTLAESETLYLQRRNAFLDHLLGRFAETFTDYALLSYSQEASALQRNTIQYKEKFLSEYPELSSTRGKADDYRVNGWNNVNVSGVEKRFEAYTGTGLGKQENLCHFEVAQFEEQTIIQIPWKDKVAIASNVTFESREAGTEALSDFLKAAGELANYEVSESRMERLFELNIKSGSNAFQHISKYETEEKANAAKGQLQRMFALQPSLNDIIPSQFEHTLMLVGKENQWTKKDPIVNVEPTFSPLPTSLADFVDVSQWTAAGKLDKNPDIKFVSHPDLPRELLDMNAFDPYVNRSDVKKKITYYKYTVSDRERNFFFVSEQEFEDETRAHENLLRLLFLLIDAANYHITDKSENEFVMNVVVKDQQLATNTIEFPSEAEARQAISPIVEYIQRHSYRLQADTRPVRWRFDLKLGQPGSVDIAFVSNNEYTDVDHALAEAAKITAPSGNITVSLSAKNKLELKDKRHLQKVLAHGLSPEGMEPAVAKELANDFLSFKKSLVKMHADPHAAEAQRMVVPDRISRQGNFGYRLVRKDYYNAWYKIDGEYSRRETREKKISEVFKLYSGNAPYLHLLYGDSNLIEKKDPKTGMPWYHFRIIDISTGLVMFESIRGYASEALALKAFEERYVSTVTSARDESSYESLISFEETILHATGSCDAPLAEVYVPAETMKRFGYNTDHTRRQLAALAATFPIQSIKKSDPRFVDYFPCYEKGEPDPEDEDSCTTIEKEYYFFAYKHGQDNQGAWISDRYFETALQALREFTSFLMLLRYRGNYIINRDECNCRWWLAVREILAESKNRFPTAKAAWGKEGVEKFISASQSKGAFPLIRRETDCCFSFHVACGERGLIHPCTYDTAEKRDKAIQRLFYASTRVVENWRNKTSDDWIEVLKTWNHPTTDQMKRGSRCQTLVEWIERFLKGEFEKAFEQAGSDTATPVLVKKKSSSPSYEQMKKVARYFPVRRKKLETAAEQYHYYLHVNLPDFDETDEDPDPCGCEKSDLHCCTPWISECCFDTCEEALRYYYDMLECLADKDHYYPVMECGCNAYGIRFYCDCNEKRRNANEQGMTGPSARDDQRREHVSCCNEIVAFNPQCYTTPIMACDAIDRARRLINAEGLHLVEHILLRPHCRESDCKCIIQTCPPGKYPCQFVWKISGDDPCENEKKFCFEPGSDPYSFVATVVMPIWPERFRKKENRELVEKLIYREMPAHILSRILWLSPQDLCLFESIYRQWTKWLAHKPVCVDYQPACQLIKFLFDYPFHCYDCDDCEPCPPGPTVDPCNFMQASDEVVPNRYVNEINKLFCWNEICPPPVQEQSQPVPVMEPIAETPVPIVALRETEENMEEAERKIDLRFHRYREAVDVISKSSGNINSQMAAAFLNQSIPVFNAYKTVVDAIIANKRSPENRRLLGANEKKELIRTLTWYYLDRNVLASRIHESKEEMEAMLARLNSKQLLPNYKEWKSQELTKVKKDAPVNEVKKLFDNT